MNTYNFGRFISRFVPFSSNAESFCFSFEVALPINDHMNYFRKYHGNWNRDFV